MNVIRKIALVCFSIVVLPVFSYADQDPAPDARNELLLQPGALAWVDTIKIGPGVSDDKWTQLRGALPKLQADCLYFTKYAPCEFEFTME